jgi:DNA-binding response OmpR family regulator
MPREFRRRTDGARILLVEDNEDFCSLMNLTLSEAGYEVDCATFAEDGMRMLESQRYHLVVSDYSLPGFSGVWLLSQAIARHLMPRDAALLVTGDPEAPGITDAIPVITKPVDFDRLLTQIRTTLASCPHVERSEAA